MAIYGLQEDFVNRLLNKYFGRESIDLTKKTLYVGLGVTQQGALVNLPDFSEVFGGRNIGNYKRAEVIFGTAEDCRISNISEIMFDPAEEDWTGANEKIERIGIFDTVDYEDSETKELIKPLVILRLATPGSVLRGESVMFAANSIELSLTDY